MKDKSILFFAAESLENVLQKQQKPNKMAKNQLKFFFFTVQTIINISLHNSASLATKKLLINALFYM